MNFASRGVQPCMGRAPQCKNDNKLHTEPPQLLRIFGVYAKFTTVGAGRITHPGGSHLTREPQVGNPN